MHTQEKTFEGFSQAGLNFLVENAQNNNKLWFESNCRHYEQYVLTPLKNLVTDLTPFMLSIDEYFETRPAINKTISRIFRDTRFSKDKSFFRDCMWITFKRPNKNWQDAPGFFFELNPTFYRFGMGFYLASKKTMDNFRAAIDDKPDEFLKITSFIRENDTFLLEGEKYKRLIANDHPQEINDWYQFKNFFLTSKRDIDNLLFSQQLVDAMIASFKTISPLYRYLMLLKLRAE